MISVYISGSVSGLGASLYSALRKKSLFITVIGRTKPINLRPQDKFLKLDLSKNIEFDAVILPGTSKVIFFSNAGVIEPIDAACNISPNNFRKNGNVNFFSPFFIAAKLAQATNLINIPFYVINISSGAASTPIAGWSGYCSSKAAIKIALDCMAVENNHMTLVHVDPGAMDTNMQRLIRREESQRHDQEKYFTDLRDQQLLKKPNEVAEDIVQSFEELLR